MDPGDPSLTLPGFLREVVARYGAREALVSRERRVTYAALERDARALARALIGAGVAKGARVALWLANRPEWVVSAFAVGMLGGVLVPIDILADRRERDRVLRHSDASILLMQTGLLSQRHLDELWTDFPQIARGRIGRLRVRALPQLRRLCCLELRDDRGGAEAWSSLLVQGADVSDALLDELAAEVRPSDDALVVHASGASAERKGALHAQRAGVLQGRRLAERLRFGPADRVYSAYPFFSNAGMAASICGTLAAGGCLLVEDRFEPADALQLIERERATAVHASPRQQKALGEHPCAATRDLSSVRRWFHTHDDGQLEEGWPLHGQVASRT